MLVSERIGELHVKVDGGSDRLEYTEYGSGDRWVVLMHGLLMPRRMQQPLARALAAEGLHVVSVDLLGHGRSDRPADQHAYSMTAFAHQVVALLDHLGADRAVVGGVSLGANVALETAVLAPERVAGLRVESKDTVDGFRFNLEGGWWLLLSIVDLQHDLYPALRGILFILTLGAVWLPDPDSAASGSSLGPWLLGGLGALLVFLSAGLFWRRERRDDDSSHA